MTMIVTMLCSMAYAIRYEKDWFFGCIFDSGFVMNYTSTLLYYVLTVNGLVSHLTFIH